MYQIFFHPSVTSILSFTLNYKDVITGPASYIGHHPVSSVM